MSTIKYATVDQQIEKLKSQNLIIKNEKIAKQCLNSFGYSSIIKSYRDPYVIISEDKKTYRTGVSFEQIYSLYILDKNLRIAVMASMLDLEEHIKEITANIIANTFGTHQDDYLQYKNYQNKYKYKERFRLGGILDSLRKTLETDKEPIYHYMNKYGMVPPWILFKSVYFSTIVNFIDQLKAPEQRMMVNKMYDIADDSSIDSHVKLLMDTLYVALEYRNIAAHGGRIYNYKCKRELSFAENPDIFSEGFCLLLRLLNLLKYQGPYNYLESVLNRELNRHCNAFPQDTTYLGQILNINISSHQVVWTSPKSNKYHSHRYCSGLKHAKETDLEEALKLGLEKCKKCCKEET